MTYYRPAGRFDARGGLARTEYDGAGNTRLIVDPVGNEWLYQVDGLGREVVRIDPAGARTTTAYDTVGRVTSVTDRNNRSIAFSYDDGDRLTQEVWKSNAGVTLNIVTHTYDDNNNQLTAQDGVGTITNTYDELNRLATNTNVFGQVLTYTYDDNNRVIRREDSLGGVLTSVYDDAGRLESRLFGGSGQTPVRVDFGYSDRNEQTSKVMFGNLAGTLVLATSTYDFDDAGRLESIVNKNGAGATLSYYNYTHDDANRVESQTWWSQVGTTTYSGTNTYAYDSTNQLLTDSNATYTYDLNGNRTMSGYQTGVANRLTNDGVFTYTHDSQGNLTEQSKGSGLETWYYTWDNRDRMTSVRKTSDGSTNLVWVTYTYDAENNRIKEEEWISGGGGAGETRFALDGPHVWADLNSSNGVLVRRMFGDQIDQVLTRTVTSGANAGLWLYATDNLGSVRDLVDSTGAVQDHLDYTGFGVLTESHSAGGDRYAFTGRELNKAIKGQFNRARWFAPEVGRWVREDPIGFTAGDKNLYRYVGNEPSNLVDPAGLQSVFERPRKSEFDREFWRFRPRTEEEKSLDNFIEQMVRPKIEIFVLQPATTVGGKQRVPSTNGFSEEVLAFAPTKGVPDGHVVQHVIVDSQVFGVNGQPLQRTRNPSANFFEAWTVVNEKIFLTHTSRGAPANLPGGFDTYRTANELVPSRGLVKTKGYLRFLAGNLPDAQAWGYGKVADAGILFSRPGPNLPGWQDVGAVVHQSDVEWDTFKQMRTKVTSSLTAMRIPT